MLCWRDVTFGRHDWQLPRCALPHPDPAERCAVFGAALLEGRVLPSFAGGWVGGWVCSKMESERQAFQLASEVKTSAPCLFGCRSCIQPMTSAMMPMPPPPRTHDAELRQGLAVPPAMLLRPDLRVHKRAGELLAALQAARVDSRASLAAKWAASPGFLRHELTQCMQKGCAGALLQAWEALQAEAAAEAPPAAAAAAASKKRKKRKV